MKNFIHVKGLITLLLAAASLSAKSQSSAQLERLYTSEADCFRKAMPFQLQHRQTLAVRAAINGQRQALDQVRNARNTPLQLTSGVKKQEVSPKLTLYTPADPFGVLPLLIYLHGGGWTFGSRNSCARFCMAMARQGMAVLAVEYRLAPEHPFPAAINDALAALKCARNNATKWHIDPKRMTIGGDSAGGNLALATALKNSGRDIHSLLLFYPVTKAYTDESSSWKRYGKGYGLDAELMEAFNQAYAREQPRHPLVSPYHASDTLLRQLPPMMMVAAERDILQAQGYQFYRRVIDLGVKSRYELIPGSVHLFITVEGQPSAFRRAVQLGTEWILHN